MEEGEGARNNVGMSAGKRSCPDMICYLLSVTCNVTGFLSSGRKRARISHSRAGSARPRGVRSVGAAWRACASCVFCTFVLVGRPELDISLGLCRLCSLRIIMMLR